MGEGRGLKRYWGGGGGGLINFLLLKREDLLEGGGLFERGGGLNRGFMVFIILSTIYREYSRLSVKRNICGFKHIRIRVDRQIRFESGYVWTWKFFTPERKSCGFKNIRMRVDGALGSSR